VNLLDNLNLNTVKRQIREFSRGPLGLFLREIFNIYPPAINLGYSEVSSDLFIWRDPSIWDNYFNIAHLGPILNPHYQDSYDVLVEFYGSCGKLLGGKKLAVSYGENRLFNLSELSDGLCKNGENGTFAIFHLVDIKEMLNGERICIGERGFVSYKRKSDASLLRSYAHGNVNAVAYSLKTQTSRCIGVKQKNNLYYRAQLRLDDAISSEIALVNFLEKDTDITMYQYKGGLKEKLKSINVSSGGVVIIQSELDFDDRYIIEFESKVNFLRPVIFKYYENHFDVLHG